jgi:hypothetical protein
VWWNTRIAREAILRNRVEGKIGGTGGILAIREDSKSHPSDLKF